MKKSMEEYTSIYISEELRKARDSLQDDHPTATSNTDFASCTNRPGYLHEPHHHSHYRLRRCFGSTNLHYVISHTSPAHSSASLHGLKGALSAHPVVQRKEEEEEKWEDATEHGPQMEEEVSGSDDDEEEGKEEEEKNDTETRAPADSANSMQFQSLPQSLTPSEITRCLFDLEKECKGVERERESVMWKMEMIHRSVQTVQDIMRVLLTHLVKAQRFKDNNTRTSQDTQFTTHEPNTDVNFKPEHMPFSTHSSMTQTHTSTQTHHKPHPHCQAAYAVAMQPSETCLPHPAHPVPCCSDMLEPPSCAQHRKQKKEAFRILTELREDVGQMRLAQEQQNKEQRKILDLLHGFQQQIGSLLDRQQSTTQLDQTSVIDELAQHQCCKAKITELRGRDAEEQHF